MTAKTAHALLVLDARVFACDADGRPGDEPVFFADSFAGAALWAAVHGSDCPGGVLSAPAVPASKASRAAAKLANRPKTAAPAPDAFSGVMGGHRGDPDENARIQAQADEREAARQEARANLTGERLAELICPGGRRFEDLYGASAPELIGATSDLLKRGFALLGDVRGGRRVAAEYASAALDSGSYDELIETSRRFLSRHLGMETPPWRP